LKALGLHSSRLFVWRSVRLKMAPPMDPSAAAATSDEPPLTELESLQLKANQVTDESLESTRRMIALCEDSRGAGAKTIEMLEHQGEQLNRVENNLDGMNSEMKTAEKHLTSMEKWCGICVCPWNRHDRVKDMDATWGKGETGPSSSSGGGGQGPVSTQPTSSSSGATGGGAGGGKQQYVTRITGCAREDEMDDNLGAVSNILGDLKNMAQDMGEEINKQNKQADRIKGKTEAVDIRIKGANKRIDKQLNS